LPEDVTGHGLRYTAATRIHELGLSWEDVASITGHKTMAMAKKYSQQKKRAGNVVAVLNKANTAG
jgi:integrase